jgi:hypothetical protein
MRAIRAATRILPAHVLQRVDRLLVLDHPVGPERFEYDAPTKQAQFACLGDANDADARARALRDLLLRFRAGGCRRHRSACNSQTQIGKPSIRSSTDGTHAAPRSSQT